MNPIALRPRKKRTPSESQIEARVVAFCKKHGIYCRKFTSPSNRGVPDRLLVYKGRVMFLELKAQGQKPTALQYYEINLLRAHDATVDWADSYDRAIEEIHQALIAPTLDVKAGDLV